MGGWGDLYPSLVWIFGEKIIILQSPLHGEELVAGDDVCVGKSIVKCRTFLFAETRIGKTCQL